MTNVHGREASLKMAKGIVRSFGRHSSKAQQPLDSLADEESNSGSGAAAIEVMVSLRDDGVAVKHRFDEPFVLIGRSADCDLSLPDDHVSSRHAYLQKIFGRVVCVDLASSNGTFWPEGRRPFGWFDEEHPISIGRYHLRLVSQVAREEIAEPQFDPVSFFKTNVKTADVPKVALQYLSDSGKEESWILSRTITLVGASSCCKLRLHDESVSRVHCSLILLPEGLWIVDLLGQEGTRVNEACVRSVRLADGDVFKVGKYAFRVNYLAPESATADSNPRIHDQALAGKVISNEFAGHLIEQITVMQQQFLQHSQQQTEMMLQFFSTLHTQQHELLSQEMVRVREIDAELRELRRSLLKPAPSTGDRPLSNSSQAETIPRNESQSENLPRLKHIRTAGPPEERPAAVTNLHEADWMVSQAAEAGPENHDMEMDVETAASSPAASPADDRINKSAELQTNAVQDSARQTDESAEEREAAKPVTNSQVRDSTDTVGDFDSEAIDDAPDQFTTRNDIDQHAWILSRMHQLERERDNIFRRMVKSIFKSNY